MSHGSIILIIKVSRPIRDGVPQLPPLWNGEAWELVEALAQGIIKRSTLTCYIWLRSYPTLEVFAINTYAAPKSLYIQ
jgi:hypothetical protein